MREEPASAGEGSPGLMPALPPTGDETSPTPTPETSEPIGESTPPQLSVGATSDGATASESAGLPEDGAPARDRLPSIPILDVRLDGPSSRSQAPADSDAHASISPGRKAALGLVGGLALMAGIFAALIASDADRAEKVASSFLKPFQALAERATAERATAERVPAETTAALPTAQPSAAAPVASSPPVPLIPPAVPIAGPWRVSQLSSQPDAKVIEGTMDRRALVDALKDAGVPVGQVYRLLGVFAPLRKFDKPRRHDTFIVAMDAASHRLRAFEYQAGPTEIYQARENEGGTLIAEKLDMHVEKKRLAAAVVVGTDLTSSLRAVGIDTSLVDLLDDALEGRAQISHLHSGTRLRIVADYETALGAFARFVEVAAIEYLSTDADATSLRVYHFRSPKNEGYYDAKGHQPYKGGFRRPIPFGRISSTFNLHRMHPILHVVMPHNGVDFAADTGTPVYAASYGSIETVGDSGPSGNLVTIRHANGITTGYAHLSRFAPRLAQGTAVETRQLVGYVGSTGRSTGAHLHFSAKRNGVFIDPLSLKLDGDRVLPKPDRTDFDEQRGPLDRALDSIPLPAPLPAADATPHSATEAEDLEPAEESAH